MKHSYRGDALAQFDFTLDARGNRSQVVETLRQSDESVDVQTIDYTYDALSRLLQAQYSNGGVFRQYDYEYDLAGNRTKRVVTVGGSPTTTDYVYNAANQLTSGGVTYDDNGNLTSDGTNSYTWDRANRLLGMGGSSYEYDGLGRRVGQTVSSVVTEYLLDVQPGLAVVLAETVSGNTRRFVHGPRGLERQQEWDDSWLFPVVDGLGSVRGMVDNVWPNMDVQGTRRFAPYGVVFGDEGAIATPYGFTGELTDINDLVYLRARYLNTGLGVFASLDPIEGFEERPMSLNGYNWVEGNVSNRVDPSGMINEIPWDGCALLDWPEGDPCALYICNEHIYESCRTAQGLSACPPCPDESTSYGSCTCGWPPSRAAASVYAIYACRSEEQEECRSFLTGALAEERCQSIKQRALVLRSSPRFDLEKQGELSGVDLLAELIDYAATFPNTTTQIMADDISCVVVGVRGPNTISDAFAYGTPGVVHFLDTGMHPDYRQGNITQFLHFWAYLNTAAQGNVDLGRIGNNLHDHLSWNGQGTMEDLRLTYLGLAIGVGIYENAIAAEELSDIVRRGLTIPYPAEDPRAPLDMDTSFPKRILDIIGSLLQSGVENLAEKLGL